MPKAARLKRDPARLRVKADGGHALVAGIADEHERGDAHGVQQEHREHAERNDHERRGKAILAPEEPEPRGAEREHQAHAFEPRAHLRDLHGEAAGAQARVAGSLISAGSSGCRAITTMRNVISAAGDPQHLADA